MKDQQQVSMLPENEPDFDAYEKSEDEILNEENEFHALIRAYKRLRADRETVRLAAAMAPKTDIFDSALLIDQALELQIEVEAGLVRMRKVLAEKMDYSQLAILLIDMGVANWNEIKDPYDERLLDPVVGPALRMIRLLEPPDYIKEAKRWKIEDVLAKADGRTTLPRPDLPCSMEDALRYVANAPEVPLTALEKAYDDYLILSVPFNDNGEGLAYLQTLPFKEQLKLLRSATTIEGASFAPEGEPPGIPKDYEIDPINSSYSGEGEEVFSDENLADLASGFYDHWQEHRAHYDARYKKQEKLFKEKGQTGSLIRDRKLWVGRTESFIASKNLRKFLKLEPRLQSRPSFETAVDDFLKSFDSPGTKTPPTKKKARKFFLTLFSHKNTNMTPSALKKFKVIMKNSSIKAISDDIIKECHNKLKSKLDGQIPSRQKKT